MLRVPRTGDENKHINVVVNGSETTLENEVTRRKLMYFGNVMRSDDSLEKTLMLAMRDGKRSRGI